MSWCPDTARIKKKMLYSSSFDTLKKAYVGHKKVDLNIHVLANIVILFAGNSGQ